MDHARGSKSVEVRKKVSPLVTVTLLSGPSGDTQSLMCVVEGLGSESVSLKWEKGNVEVNNYQKWPAIKIGDYYSVTSVLKVNKADWDNKSVYSCKVQHLGKEVIEKTSNALITVTLSPPSTKHIFKDNKVELDCTITGQDQKVVSGTKITWQIDGQDIDGQEDTSPDLRTTQSGNEFSKTHRLSRSLNEWASVKKVRCSALKKDDSTPVIQDLTFHKGDGRKPTVTVHVVPEEGTERGSDEFTLVCLVTSPSLCDFYISWTEQVENQQALEYMEGITSPPQKTQNGYSVTSVYTTTKNKWQQNGIFTCNVRPAGTNSSMEPRGVSKQQGNTCDC